MTKDTKQTLLGVGVLVGLGAYLMYKKKQIQKQNEIDDSTQNFVGNRYNTKRSGRKRANSGFQNATGCTSGQLAEAMTHCEGMAQPGETTTIKKCKIRNNGNRHVTCQYTNANGGIRYINTDVGNRKMERRTR
tara:strand:- start:11597 stop:11995 length:399 start_codon:yes stop_codon:yes gene_type:complete